MLKKIIIALLVLIVLVIAGVAAVPILFKDEINAKIKEQINLEVKADVDYSSYDLSIVRSFPDLFFTLNDLTVVGRNYFEGDTLADIEQLGIGLELMKFIRGEELLINSVYLYHPKVIAYQLLTENGDTLTNYDILPSTEEVAESDLIDITARDIQIEEGNIYFKDFISGTELIAKNLNLDAAIEYIDDLAELQAKTTISSLSFSDGKISYLNEVKLNALIDLSADLTKDSFTLRDNQIALNALNISADGSVVLKDEETTQLDLSFSAEKSSFKELLSLIPPSYLKDYEDLEASGNFTLNGSAKGDLTATRTPAFDVKLSIENGSVHYPDLPSSIEKIYLDVNLKNNSSELEQMSVSIPKANFEVAGEPVEMSLYAQNALGDPKVDLKLKGNIDLSKVPDYYPLEDVRSIAGRMNADVAFKGLLSDVENENYENVDFAGHLNVDNFKYDSEDLPMPIEVENLAVEFTPKYANLTATQARIGESDFNIEGNVENLINYVLADGTAKGNLNIVSNSINLDQLMGDESQESSETSTATKVPSNLDFTTSLKANKVYYDGLEMNNVDGGVQISNETLVLDKLAANMLGGSAKINGSYSTKDTDKPALTFAYDIEKFDIKQTFEYFNAVKAIAPMAKYLTGNFSTDMSLNSFLNNDLSLDLAALNGLGEVRIPYATFNDLPIFQKVSEAINLPAFDKPSLNNAWTVLKFEDGKVNVEPFQIKMKDIVMDVQGSNGFDQTIDYTMKLSVPSDKFGGAASLANDFLSKQKIPIFNLAVPQQLTFHLNVGGILDNPTVSIVKVTADQGDKGIKDQIKDNVKDQLDNAKEQAKEEVEKVKEEIKGNFIGSKDKLKEDAEIEIDKAKEDLKETVKDKLKGFGW
ncbi:MAG: hypothetical protein ACI8V8_001568 [Chitinophagales bacterium]|jgi:hypothetical protein